MQRSTNPPASMQANHLHRAPFSAGTSSIADPNPPPSPPVSPSPPPSAPAPPFTLAPLTAHTPLATTTSLLASLTAGAHLAEWGKTQELFVKTHGLFTSAPQFKALGGAARPSWKTLADCFKKLVADRKTADRRNSQASGIAEKHGELEQLLDDVIQQVNEKHEGEQAVKNGKIAE
eukprot:IDg21992t1